ncbi:MAG: P-loop NTPase fold protein, partial [Pseudonocardiaceae bacterium]
LSATVAAIVTAVTAAAALLKPVPALITKIRGVANQARTKVARRTSELDDAIRNDEVELRQLDAARRLGDYLLQLRSPQRYEQYRGLLGRIHQDLKRLSDTLAAARKQWVSRGSVGPPPLQRIVLYVDDLDRCPPEKVIDVLRAVHLLLALPLFVVIVAVDPRWLRRALQQHHDLLFQTSDKEWQTSPADYLDKIFQIPYALRPIGGRAGGYIRSLLPEAVQQMPMPVASTLPPVAATTEATKAKELATPAVPGRPDVDPGAFEKKPDALWDKAERRTESSPVRRVDDLRPEGLRLSAPEREFLPRLGPLLATPRSAKRLVNLYRLLRIGIPEAELPAFVGGEDGGPYQAAAILLATVIGLPADARVLLTTLPTANPREDIISFLQSSDEDWHRLTDLIETIRKAVAVHGELASYQQWARTVARFSFETYDLFLSS